jgi:thioredoxin 1
MNIDIPTGVLELYDDTIDDMINNDYGLPLFIDLWAEWCMPCKKIAPVVKQLEEDYRGKMLFAKLDIDNNQTTASKYRVISIPMFLIFKDGKLADSSVGATGKDKFVKRIDKVLEED